MINIITKPLKNNKIRRTINLIGLFTLALLPVKVMAGCPDKSIYATAPSEVILDPSVGVGGVMATMNVYWPDTPYCTGIFKEAINEGTGTPNGNLYQSPFGGVAYRIYVTSWGYPLNGYWPNYQKGISFGSGLRGGNPAVIEIVKTQDFFGAGEWRSSAIFGRATLRNLFGSVTYVLRFSNPVVLKVPTCTITNSNISFSLNEAETKDLTKAGDVSKEKSFLIPINCPVARNLSLQFSGDMADSTRGVYRNQNSSSANRSTLGIQVLFGSTGVQPGVNYNIGVINGFRNIGMSARYYALADNVAGGSINSTAYATIIYN